MLYGFHFISDAKVPLQVNVDTNTLQIFVRSAPNGQWTGWRRLDAERDEQGNLKETATEALHAKVSDTAARLSKTIKIVFAGEVTGEMSLDGSGDVTCSLAGNMGGTIQRLAAEAVAAHEAQYHPVIEDPNDGG